MRLSLAQIANAKMETSWILSEVMELPVAQLYVQQASPVQQERFWQMVAQRESGMPLQYLLGTQPFCGHSFLVQPGVLIPRPETELLCAAIINGAKQGASVLDLCCGTGCVGISAKIARADLCVTCADVDLGCVALAQKNAQRHNVCIQTVQGDLFEPFKSEKFDVIACNPPYIPTEDIAGLQIEVRQYEPLLALDGGADGLAFYKKIALQAQNYLHMGGQLVLECGVGQAQDVCGLLAQNQWHKINTTADENGILRVVSAYKIETVRELA